MFLSPAHILLPAVLLVGQVAAPSAHSDGLQAIAALAALATSVGWLATAQLITLLRGSPR